MCGYSEIIDLKRNIFTAVELFIHSNEKMAEMKYIEKVNFSLQGQKFGLSKNTHDFKGRSFVKAKSVWSKQDHS